MCATSRHRHRHRHRHRRHIRYQFVTTLSTCHRYLHEYVQNVYDIYFLNVYDIYFLYVNKSSMIYNKYNRSRYTSTCLPSRRRCCSEQWSASRLWWPWQRGTSSATSCPLPIPRRGTPLPALALALALALAQGVSLIAVALLHPRRRRNDPLGTCNNHHCCYDRTAACCDCRLL